MQGVSQHDMSVLSHAFITCLGHMLLCTDGVISVCFVAGYKFTEQGISLCGVNTSQAVGTTYSVNFMVFDLSIPSKNASVTRTIQIIDPCNPGQYLCSDGTCSSVTCDVR